MVCTIHERQERMMSKIAVGRVGFTRRTHANRWYIHMSGKESCGSGDWIYKIQYGYIQ